VTTARSVRGRVVVAGRSTRTSRAWQYAATTGRFTRARIDDVARKILYVVLALIALDYSIGALLK
jgi:hypothetical protein